MPPLNPDSPEGQAAADRINQVLAEIALAIDARKRRAAA